MVNLKFLIPTVKWVFKFLNPTEKWPKDEMLQRILTLILKFEFNWGRLIAPTMGVYFQVDIFVNVCGKR